MTYKKFALICAGLLLVLSASFTALAANTENTFKTPLTKTMQMAHFTIKLPSNFRRALDKVEPTSKQDKHNIHIYRYDGTIENHDISITLSASKFKVDDPALVNEMLINTLAHVYNTLYLKVPVRYRYLMSNTGIKTVTIGGIPAKRMYFRSQDEDEYLQGIILTTHYENEANVIIAASLVKHDEYDKNSIVLLQRILNTITPKPEASQE